MQTRELLEEPRKAGWARGESPPLVPTLPSEMLPPLPQPHLEDKVSSWGTLGFWEDIFLPLFTYLLGQWRLPTPIQTPGCMGMVWWALPMGNREVSWASDAKTPVHGTPSEAGSQQDTGHLAPLALLALALGNLLLLHPAAHTWHIRVPLPHPGHASRFPLAPNPDCKMNQKAALSSRSTSLSGLQGVCKPRLPVLLSLT